MKMELELAKTECEGVEWIHVSQDRVQQ